MPTVYFGVCIMSNTGSTFFGRCSAALELIYRDDYRSFVCAFALLVCAHELINGIKTGAAWCEHNFV